jgi:hypothetical protein
MSEPDALRRAQELLIELRALQAESESGHPHWDHMRQRFENLCNSVDFLLARYIDAP